MGDALNYDHRGIAPRSISQLFGEVNSRVECEYRVSCTYMEIYNERIFDLLADLGNPDQASDFTIAEEKDGRGTFVRGLTELEVANENEALNLLFSGELARTTATHKLNRKSNRSHSIFTVYLQQRQRSGVSERVVHSKLHLVDLAGSERLKKTLDSADGSVGDETTRKESMAINQSLTYLEQCVIALARKGSHIPYRQSKLTNVIKDCLGANCNTLMIACMWGEKNHLEETVSTLRLASRMMRVQNETSMVETIDSAALIKKQARMIKALKQELLMHDALVERTGMAYEPFTPEQQAGIAQMLERYVEARETEEEDMLNINSYRQMIETCKQFKRMVLSARMEAASAREEAVLGASMGLTGRPATGADFGTLGVADTRIADDFDPQNANFVGESDGRGGGGFSLGEAGGDSRPVGGVEGAARFARSGAVGGPKPPMGSPGRGKGVAPGRSKGVDFPGEGGGKQRPAFDSPQDGGGQNAVFEAFARGDGSELYNDFMDAKAQAKELRLRSREFAQAVNDYKASIDSLQADIETRKVNRIDLLRKSGLKPADMEDIVDEEEFRLMKDLREVKRAYKNSYEQMHKCKSSAAEALAKAEVLREDLAAAFSSRDTFGASGPGYEQEYTAPGDQLDDQEAFDRLETERVLSNDADSLAFFHAQKTRRALLTQNLGNIKQMQKNKRNR